MGVLDNLLAQAVGNSAYTDDSFSLNENSTNMEILDWIFIELCQSIDLSSVAFKGGYILNKIIPDNKARATVDIDFSISRQEYYEVVRKCMNRIGSVLVDRGIIKSYIVKDSVQETMTGGIDLYRFGNQEKALGIDVGWHDIEYGLNTINVSGIDVNIFSIERMLADKISAMFSRKRFRRPKDLYDFYIITKYFNVDLMVLDEYILKRAPLDWDASPFNQEVLVQYRKAYDKLTVRNPSLDVKNVTSEKPEFNDIINRLSMITSYIGQPYVWDCNRRELVYDIH